MTWEQYQEHALSEAAWYATLDNRYICEVQRTEAYNGVLCIFDHNNNDELIHSEDVGISYDALFGPDVSDVAEWQDKCIEVVDGINNSG